MSLLGGLLLLPVTAPVRGFQFVLERLRDEANAVMLDEGRAYAELIDLSRRRSAGELSDEDYAQQEADLLERLSIIRQYRDELLYGAADIEEDEEESLLADPEDFEDEPPSGDDDSVEQADDSDESDDADAGEEDDEDDEPYDELADEVEDDDIAATDSDMDEESW